jgi:nucleoside-diphosphate-sugar epimerase
VLINNIAYLVKRFPVFPIPGDGEYVMQFIHAEDFADLTLKTILWRGKENIVIDTVSPDKLSFKTLVEYIA